MARLALFLFLLTGLAVPGRAQLLERVVEGKTRPFAKTVSWTWTKDGKHKDVTLRLTAKVAGKPAQLIIGRDHPNGTRILIVHGNRGDSLPTAFDKDIPAFNSFGDINPDYVIQAAEYDFDGDRVPELVIAVGDKLTELSVNVFRLKAGKTWERVGTFTGQAKAALLENAIILPYGSQGLFEARRWKSGKFVKTDR